MKGLYEIFSSSEDGMFEVRLNPEHGIFRGHFPDNPVLPGICSLMIIRDCASLMATRSLEYASVKESKFLSVITPDTPLSIRLKLSKDNDHYPLDAIISCGETTMFKLKASLKAHE